MDVIATHINADFDCLGSMIAAKRLYPDAVLVFPVVRSVACAIFAGKFPLCL